MTADTPPTRQAAVPSAVPSAVARFDALVEGIGAYGGQSATPPHVLAPDVAALERQFARDGHPLRDARHPRPQDHAP